MTPKDTKAGEFDTENQNTDGVYEPYAGRNDDPAEHMADMDPSKKRAATLADGSDQAHMNVKKTATRADGPEPTGVKVSSDDDQNDDDQGDEIPTMVNTADQIKAYLDKLGIAYKGVTVKADLLALIPA